jgi:hypothetical protein
VHNDVDEVHEAGDVVAEPKEMNPIGEPERASLVAKLASVLMILPEEGVADEQGVDTRHLGEGVQQNVLSFPGGQSAKYAHHWGIAQSKFLAEVGDLIVRDGLEGGCVDAVVGQSRRGSPAALDEGGAGGFGVDDDSTHEPIGAKDRQTPVEGREVIGREEVVEGPHGRPPGQARSEAPHDEGLLGVQEDDIEGASQADELQYESRDGRQRAKKSSYACTPANV